MGLRQWAGRYQLWQVNRLFHYRGDQMESEIERKFWYGLWKIPKWNEKEDFKNGMEDNLPYQFHIRFFVHGIFKKFIRMLDSDK